MAQRHASAIKATPDAHLSFGGVRLITLLRVLCHPTVKPRVAWMRPVKGIGGLSAAGRVGRGDLCGRFLVRHAWRGNHDRTVGPCLSRWTARTDREEPHYEAGGPAVDMHPCRLETMAAGNGDSARWYVAVANVPEPDDVAAATYRSAYSY